MTHRTEDGWCGIYFAGTVDGNLVKIGSTYRPNKRISGVRGEALYCFGAEDCSYLAVFPVCVRRPWMIEHGVQERFKRSAVRSEWFRLREIETALADMKQRYREFGIEFFYKTTNRYAGRFQDDRIWLDSPGSEWWNPEALKEPERPR